MLEFSPEVMQNPIFSRYVALALKTVGAIVILLSLVDLIVLAIPLQVFDPDWQITFTEQAIDRGIIPMVGIAFFLSGAWLQELFNELFNDSFNYPTQKQQKFLVFHCLFSQELNLGLYGFAGLMGLLFFLLVPLHLNNLDYSRLKTVVQLDRSEQHFKTQAKYLQDRYHKNRDRVRLEMQDGRKKSTPNNNLSQLEREYNLAQQALEKRRRDTENRIVSNASKSSFRVGANSLLLSVGYLIIGWMGFRNHRCDRSSLSPSRVHPEEES